MVMSSTLFFKKKLIEKTPLCTHKSQQASIHELLLLSMVYTQFMYVCKCEYFHELLVELSQF